MTLLGMMEWLWPRSSWFAARAARVVDDWFITNEGSEYVTLEDLGIERVKIGPDI